MDELNILIDFNNLKKGTMFLKLYLMEYNEFYDVTKEFDIKLRKKLCNSCLKYKIEDYDAIIQLRSHNPNLISDFYSEIESRYQHTNMVIKKEIYEYGVDVYFIDLNEARKFARSFSKKYDLKLKESFSTKKRIKRRYTILLSTA